jgi:hypothetical protein
MDEVVRRCRNSQPQRAVPRGNRGRDSLSYGRAPNDPTTINPRSYPLSLEI